MTCDELLAANPAQLSPPYQPNGLSSLELVWDRLHQALAGGIPAFEWTHRGAAGMDVRCEVRMVRLPAEGRRLVRGSITDVTRQRQLEEHLQQWQKVETLGQLAGGIAHDFNNVLFGIGGSADLLAAELPESGAPRQLVEEIRRAAGRGATLTRQLLAFARRQRLDLDTVDLNAVIDQALAMARRLLPEGIEVIAQLDPTGAPVQGARGQLDQVILNLVLNARDAMPEGGTITVTPLRRVAGRRSDDEQSVHLTVSDTGIGMDSATRERAFEPFYTTKPSGEGTGLGLATVATIVRQCGGEVGVTSQPGAGATFHLTFPDVGP